MVREYGESVTRAFLIRLTKWINKFEGTNISVNFVRIIRFVLVRVVSRLSKKSYKQYINNSIAHISYIYEFRCRNQTVINY